LKRHDYDVEITGGTLGAHYIDGYVEVSGIKFPTVRRIFARLADGGVNRDPVSCPSTFQTSGCVEHRSRLPCADELSKRGRDDDAERGYDDDPRDRGADFA
jgi:hypothetical protein